MLTRCLLAVFALACFLVSIPRNSYGQQPVKAMVSAMPDAAQDKAGEQEIVKLTQDWAAASKGGDVAKLEHLFLDDFSYIHTTSVTSYKKEFLDEIKSGDRRWDYYDLSNLKARVYGDSAIAVGHIHIKVIVKNEQVNELNAIVSVFWVKQPDWRMAELQMTRLPDKPAAPAAPAAQ